MFSFENIYICCCEWCAIQNQIPFDIFGNFASAHKTKSKYFRLYDWPLSKHKRYCLPNQIRSHAWHQNISTFSIGHNVGCWNPTVIMTNCRVHTQPIDELILYFWCQKNILDKKDPHLRIFCVLLYAWPRRDIAIKLEYVSFIHLYIFTTPAMQ